MFSVLLSFFWWQGLLHFTSRHCPCSRLLEGQQGEKSRCMGLHVPGRSPLPGGRRTEGVAFWRLWGTAQGEPAWIPPSLHTSPSSVCLSMGHNTNHLISALLLPFYLFASQAYTHRIFTEVDTLCTSIPFWSYIISLTANRLFRDLELPMWPSSALTVMTEMSSNCYRENRPVSEGEKSLLPESQRLLSEGART